MNLKQKIANVKNFEELKLLKHQFYHKNDQLNNLKKSLKLVEKNQKPIIGQKIHRLITEAEQLFANKEQILKNQKIADKINREWIDINEPIFNSGSFHPLTIIANRFRTWLISHNYYEVLGNDIEQDKYNFEKLNIPQNHPAREMQDSLYINNHLLLRTHNTSYSARELEKNANQSFNSFSIGNVYRNDEDDATHSHQFMQLDLISVGYLSMSNLLWTIKNLLSYVFEKEVEIKIRPSFFPFTEPSIEIDIKYNDQWVEVLGGGIIHREVLKSANYTNDMVAFAFGIGIDRIAMIKYSISDIRELYKNDWRFLSQFKGVT